jgi:hypothetical protein
MDHESPQSATRASRSGRGTIAFTVMLAIAAFFLVSEHRAHVLGFLPYLLILACPLMHLLHHGGHGGHGSGGHSRPRPGEDASGKREEARS